MSDSRLSYYERMKKLIASQSKSREEYERRIQALANKLKL